MGAVENKPESLSKGPAGGLNGTCPRCKKGELRAIPPGKYVAMRHNRKVELINRAVYQCNNPDCDYENVALIFQM